MEECAFDNCNMITGHPGPHGIHVGSGLVLAPHGGGEGKIGDDEPAPTACDCCEAPMVAHRYSNGGGELSCTRCQQNVSFLPDGEKESAILAKLFPSKMSERSRVYREFLNHRANEVAWDYTARHFFGLCTEEEKNDAISEINKLVADKLLEINSISWWQFWRVS